MFAPCAKLQSSKLGVLFGAALILQGCGGHDGVPITTIYNNTATDLTVHYIGGSLPWPRNSALFLGEYEKDRLALGASVPCKPISAISAWCEPGVGAVNLALTAAGADPRSYILGFKSVADSELLEASYPPREYMQLEEGGLLYVVRKPAHWPASIPPRQPNGFPLQPQHRPSPSETKASQLPPSSRQK